MFLWRNEEMSIYLFNISLSRAMAKKYTFYVDMLT